MPGTNDIGLRMARGRGRPVTPPQHYEEPPTRVEPAPPERINLPRCPFGRGAMSSDPATGQTFAGGVVTRTRNP